ncbi:MAG: ArnT family glycosyltransferase [Kiritimatiellia bacterium]
MTSIAFPAMGQNDCENSSAVRPTKATIVSVHRTRTGWLAWCGVLALALLYAFFLSRFYAPAIATPDANGYFAQGTLLARTGRAYFTLDSPVQYVGIHWLRDEQGRYFSRYPPGLAVLVALVSRVFSAETSVALNPLLSIIGLVGMFFLARSVLGGVGWGYAAMALLMVNPAYSRHAIACDSHMAVTVLFIWGLLLLLRWAAEGALWQTFVAGLLLGAIPTVRYPEALYSLGVGTFLLGHCRSRSRIWLHYAVAALGAAIPMVPLLVRNQLAFGAFWRTAYSFTNEQTGFCWQYLKEHFVPYVKALQSHGAGLFFALGVAGVLRMFAQQPTRLLGSTLFLLITPSTLLYMSYYWGGGMMGVGTMRFLLPLFPLFILAGLFAVQNLFQEFSFWLRCGAVTILLVIQAIWGIPDTLAELGILRYQKQGLAEITSALKTHVPVHAVVLSHPRLLQHLDFLRVWRLVDPSLARPWPEAEEPEEQTRPRPMQAGKRKFQTMRYEHMGPLEREEAFAADVKAWAGTNRVFYVGVEKDIQAMRSLRFNVENFRIVARVEMPSPPQVRPDSGRGRRPPPTVPEPRAPQRRIALAPPPREGPFGLSGFLKGEKEVVIAEWILDTLPAPSRPCSPERPPRSLTPRLFDRLRRIEGEGVPSGRTISE